MLDDAHFSLIHDGRFIKRRGISGEVQSEIRVPEGIDLPSGIPLVDDDHHYLNPDVSSILPIALEFVDPRGELARRTLADVEELWNQRWEGGGYGRYHVSSEPDSPGPWPFPSVFVARAYLEAGDDAKVWRILNWLHGGVAAGRKAGTFFEFYGPRPVPPYAQVGIPPWTWAEIIGFFIHHLLGVRPDLDGLILRPRLLAGLNRISARLTVRRHTLNLTLDRAKPGGTPGFLVNGIAHAYSETGLHLPQPDADLTVTALLPA